MDRSKLHSIHRLSDMIKDQKQGHLNHLLARSQALQDQLSGFEEALRTRAECQDLDAARQAGADQAWTRWIDARKIAINSERARLAHDIAVAKAELARALGRANVSEQLCEQADAKWRAGRAKA